VEPAVVVPDTVVDAGIGPDGEVSDEDGAADDAREEADHLTGQEESEEVGGETESHPAPVSLAPKLKPARAVITAPKEENSDDLTVNKTRKKSAHFSRISSNEHATRDTVLQQAAPAANERARTGQTVRKKNETVETDKSMSNAAAAAARIFGGASSSSTVGIKKPLPEKPALRAAAAAAGAIFGRPKPTSDRAATRAANKEREEREAAAERQDLLERRRNAAASRSERAEKRGQQN
jgi:hypothetical protein